MDVMDKLQNLTNLGKSTREKQKIINVSEVFYIWDILLTKFDILETIQILEDYIEDKDLELINGQVANAITTGITDMEKLMADYGIPFPDRPPFGKNATNDVEQFTDSYIYQALFDGIRSFFPILANGFMNSTTPQIRKALKNHLLLTMEVQELMVEYGKLKGFLNQPPVYRL